MKKFILGKVKTIYKTYALIETNQGLGICHISNFSDYKINDLKKFIELYNPKYFYVLKKANDEKKDQSYFLYRLPREILPKIIFPLEEYKKKKK